MRNKRIAASFMFLSLALTVHASDNQSTFKKSFPTYPAIIWKIRGEINRLNFDKTEDTERRINFEKKRPALTKMVKYHIKEWEKKKKFKWRLIDDEKMKIPVIKDKYVRWKRHHYPHVEKLRDLVTEDLLSLFKGTNPPKIMPLLYQFSEDDINSESITNSDRFMALLEADKDFSKEQTVQDFFQSESMRKKDNQIFINIPLGWASFFGIAGASLGAASNKVFGNKKEPSENTDSQSSNDDDESLDELIGDNEDESVDDELTDEFIDDNENE